MSTRADSRWSIRANTIIRSLSLIQKACPRLKHCGKQYDVRVPRLCIPRSIYSYDIPTPSGRRGLHAVPTCSNHTPLNFRPRLFARTSHDYSVRTTRPNFS